MDITPGTIVRSGFFGPPDGFGKGQAILARQPGTLGNPFVRPAGNGRWAQVNGAFADAQGVLTLGCNRRPELPAVVPRSMGFALQHRTLAAMNQPISPPSARPRFGLGRQAVLTAALCVAGLLAATALAHFLQWELSVSTRQVLDRDAPRSVVALEIAYRAAQCCQFQKDLEIAHDQKAARRKALDSWDSAHKELVRRLDKLAALDLDDADLALVDAWRAAAAHCRADLHQIADQLESGRLSNRSALHDAMKDCQAAMQQCSADAHIMADAHSAEARSGSAALRRIVASRTRLINVRAVAGILVLAMLVVWFRRRVLARLKDLSATAMRFASGDLTARASSSAGDELGALGHHFNEMASAIQNSHQQLHEANRTAQQASQAKSEFLAGISQEMRAPLQVIAVHADMLLATPENPEKTEAAGAIKHNSEYLLGIVNDIFDLSKIETGRLRIERVACSPCRIVNEVASLMKARADAKGLSLRVEYGGPIPETIQTDPARLQQILLNLMGNAIKFTEIGEVRLVTRFLPNAAGRPKLQFDVIDTGVGMTEEQTSRLFAPAAPDDASSGCKVPGGGLGLTICKRLTDMLGGTISVTSAPGIGSTLTVIVPSGPLQAVRMIDAPGQVAAAHEKQAQPQAKTASQPRFRILLAEDGPENRRLMSFILKKAGAEVVIAENGQEVVEKVLGSRWRGEDPDNDQYEPFDLILMDMQMPITDGYEATRLLRQEGYPGLIIAVTGHTMSYDRQKCLDAGCNDYLAKPVDREKLLATVARHVACRCRHRAPQPGPGTN